MCNKALTHACISAAGRMYCHNTTATTTTNNNNDKKIHSFTNK